MSSTKRIPEVLGLVTALVLAGACDTLKIDNPNAPDSPRALSDPSTVQSIAVGAMRTWYLTTQGDQIGRASGRERGKISVVAESLKKKKEKKDRCRVNRAKK